MAFDYETFPDLPREELVNAAYDVTGGNVADLDAVQLARLITIASFVFDCCLNEFERRGFLLIEDGMPVVPYISEHAVETVLTRP